LLLETDCLLTLKQRCVEHIPCRYIATNTHELVLVEMHHVLLLLQAVVNNSLKKISETDRNVDFKYS